MHYLITFLYHKFNLPVDAPFFVSGDDSIFLLPKGTDVEEVQKFFASLGFDMKLEKCQIQSSGFCGFSFDPDNDNERVSKDPVTTLINFFNSFEIRNFKNYLSYLKDKALCLLHEYPGDPTFRKGIEFILSTKGRFKKMIRDWWNRVLMRNGDKSAELLAHPTSSFEFVAENSGLNITAEELKEMSELFEKCCRALFDKEFGDRNPEVFEKLRNWLEEYDHTNNWPRWYFNFANRAGLLDQDVNPQIYFNWIPNPNQN